METLIVGINESETASRALERAGFIAGAVGGRLVVVTAYGYDDVDVVGFGSDTYVLSTADRAADFARDAAARIAADHGIEAEGVAVQGKPADVLVEQALARDATMVVVGNVRMQGVGRLLGSVANDVAHRAPCDVVVVKTT